jgi:hypothetical protein
MITSVLELLGLLFFVAAGGIFAFQVLGIVAALAVSGVLLLGTSALIEWRRK